MLISRSSQQIPKISLFWFSKASFVAFNTAISAASFWISISRLALVGFSSFLGLGLPPLDPFAWIFDPPVAGILSQACTLFWLSLHAFKKGLECLLGLSADKNTRFVYLDTERWVHRNGLSVKYHRIKVRTASIFTCHYIYDYARNIVFGMHF